MLDLVPIEITLFQLNPNSLQSKSLLLARWSLFAGMNETNNYGSGDDNEVFPGNDNYDNNDDDDDDHDGKHTEEDGSQSFKTYVSLRPSINLTRFPAPPWPGSVGLLLQVNYKCNTNCLLVKQSVILF